MAPSAQVERIAYICVERWIFLMVSTNFNLTSYEILNVVLVVYEYTGGVVALSHLNLWYSNSNLNSYPHKIFSRPLFMYVNVCMYVCGYKTA